MVPTSFAIALWKGRDELTLKTVPMNKVSWLLLVLFLASSLSSKGNKGRSC